MTNDPHSNFPMPSQPLPPGAAMTNDPHSNFPMPSQPLPSGAAMTPSPEMTPQQMMQMQQQMMQMQQMQQMQMQQQGPRKTGDRERGAAILLALFLGGLGVHKFYLGQSGMGIVYLIFCWTFIPAIVAFLEVLVYLSQSKHDFDQKYNYA